jgi:atypical dual specificity phosphatase
LYELPVFSNMPQPSGFTWIEKPLLGGMARPDSREDLDWLRENGIELIVSLSEEPLRREWVNEAGLLSIHIPVEDMEAPTQEQLDHAISAIRRANARPMGVAVHCTAGLGRTGVVLACWLVANGMSASNAIARVRRLRPGSIETDDQAEAIAEFARRQSAS